MGGRFLKAIGDATSISSFPLQLMNGDSSLVKACAAAVPYIVSEPVVIKAGVAVKSFAAEIAAGATKLGCEKLAALSLKVAFAGSALVGTAAATAGLVLACACGVWLAKQMIKELGEIIDTMAGVRDTGDVGKELMSVVAAAA